MREKNTALHRVAQEMAWLAKRSLMGMLPAITLLPRGQWGPCTSARQLRCWAGCNEYYDIMADVLLVALPR